MTTNIVTEEAINTEAAQADSDVAEEVTYTEEVIATDPAAYTDPDERPGLPKMLSPSRMEDFGQCPRQFFYKSVLRLPTEPSIPAARGTIAHTVLEELFAKPREERTPEVALSLIDGAWETNLADDYHAETLTHLFDDADDPDTARAEFFEAVAGYVKNYFTIENPTRFDALECETWVRANLDGHGYVGVIDRLDRIEMPDGERELWITDYKTGKLPKMAYAADKFSAMKVYAVLVAQMRDETPTKLRLVYLSHTGADAVLSLDVNETTIANTAARMSAVSKAIARAHRTWDWKPTPNRLCNWCDYREICPAKGDALVDAPVTVRRRNKNKN